MRIQLTIQPTEGTLSTASVFGGQDSRVLDATAAQVGGIRDHAALIASGGDASALQDVLALSDRSGVEAYLALANPAGADAYIALTNADILAVVNAAVGLDNMSAGQKAGLLAYIAAIIAETTTTTVEAAIAAL